jgi:UDP-GlcNAc:undecaprenyl-phosphate/decaprenyl-phosphate GlcNAc-1-phosphate transferase
MITMVISFLVALAVSFAATPLVRKLALHYQVTDNPHERKVHEEPVPRMGGIAIFLGFMAGYGTFVLLAPDWGMQIWNRFWGVYVGGTFILLIGIYDDIKGTNCYEKFIGQIISAAFVVYTGYRIMNITNPFGGAIELGIWSVPVTILWIVAITNAVNLIDGLDGLAAGVSVIVCFTLFLIAYNMGTPQAMNKNIMVLCLLLIGTTLGFLRSNFNPAVIFMGDTGSLVLGFVIACISIRGSYTAPTTVAITIPIIALGVPIIDTILAIFRRTSEGRHPFRADREHVHHKLLDMGFSHKTAVMIIYTITVLFCMVAILMTAVNSLTSGALLVLIVAVVFIGIRSLGYFELRVFKQEQKEHRLNHPQP